MAETEENTTETKVSKQGDTQVVKQRTSGSSTAETRLTLANGIWFVVGAIEVLLAFRFVLKLLGANPASGFVSFVYSVSSPLIAPFSGIFSTPTTEGDITTSVFETSVIIAIIVYALIGWGLAKLTSLNKE